jgi:oxygen-independent coproporphyrinogen III oxidase
LSGIKAPSLTIPSDGGVNATLLSYSDRPAPRYTSYPTAPHFSPCVDSAVYQGWLGALSRADSLSIYIHVPYCRELCWYCGCNTAAVRRDELLASYVETLCHEIALAAAATPARRVAEIHWGGGTPSILSGDRFSAIFDTLAAAFEVAPDVAHAVEIDPRTMTPELAAAYVAAGVNRASLGVQDFNPHVQAAIGRVQSLETVRIAVTMLRDAGVGAINMDLMYGLPLQTVADVEASVDLAVRLGPNRVSLFGYAHVPWFKKRQTLIDGAALPRADVRFAQAEAARVRLLERGYVPIGMDHFARSGDPLAIAAAEGALRRNFQGYVTSESACIMGFGPSAISTLPQGFAQNASEVGAWRRAIAADRLATIRGHALTDDDRTRAGIIEELMCNFAVNLEDYGGTARYGAELARLGPFVKDGLIEVSGARITIQPQARPLCRLVAQSFDSYVSARHSPAV